MIKPRSTNAGGAANDAQKAVYKPTPIEAKAIEAYRAAKDKHGPRLKVAVTAHVLPARLRTAPAFRLSPPTHVQNLDGRRELGYTRSRSYP